MQESKKEIIKKLIELQKLTNQIIDDLQKEKDTFHEAINWGNLNCIEASYTIDQDGYEYYCVIIQEASPDAMMFGNEIYNRLTKIWNKPIAIQTEW